MGIVNRIDEALKEKPSFAQYFFNKTNYRKLQKEFDRDYEDLAIEMGQDVIDDERYYSEEEREEMEIDPVEAYENYAHSMGYSAEWDAAHNVVMNNKSKYNYQRGDETDRNELIVDFIEYMGYAINFNSAGKIRSKRKEDYWKMAEQ